MTTKKSDKPRTFLTFKSGKFSFIHNFTNINLHALTTEAVILNETIADLPILPNLVSKLELEVHYRSIAGTAAIENNPLTEADVRRLAEGKEVQGYSQKHKQEILNLLEVFKILTGSDFKHPMILSESFIKSIHKEITKNVPHEFNIPGNYRNNEVFVGDNAHGGIYRPPRILKDVENLMQQFIEWINNETVLALNPIIRAALAHYHLCLIHPFADGNGRTARFLETMLLKSSGMTYALKELSNFYYRNIDDYYIAFSKTEKLAKQNDVSPFLEFMLKGAVHSLRENKANVTSFIRVLTLKDYLQFLLMDKAITKRQYDFLLILLKNRPEPFDLGDLFSVPMFTTLYGSLSKQTARRDLKKFESMALLLKTHDARYIFNMRALG